MTEDSPNDRKQGVKKLVRLLITLLAMGLLVWLLDRIGWRTIGQAFLRVGWLGAILLLAIGFAENLLNAAAVCLAVEWRVGLMRMLAYNGAGMIVNNIIPWEAGEVLKGTLLRNHVNTRDAIYGMIVWNYMLKLSGPSIALTATLIAWILGHEIDSRVAALVLLACILAFTPFFVLHFLLSRGVAGFFVRVLHRARIIKKDPEQLMASARELDQKIKSFWQEKPGDFIKMFLLQALAKACGWLTWYVAIQLVGLDYSFGLCSIIFAGYSVMVYITPIIPAKIGVNEGAGYVLFVLYGLDGGMGLIVTVIARIKGLVSNGLAGVFAFVRGSRPY